MAKTIDADDAEQHINTFRQWLNRQHFTATRGGKTLVFQDRDGRMNPIEPDDMLGNGLTFQGFRDYYIAKKLTWTVEDEATGKTKTQVYRAADDWLHWDDHRSYRAIAFDPSGDCPYDIYNLWKGFKYEPDPEGDWSLFYDHIRDVICCGDEDLFEYVLGWMAFAVQHPETPPGVALVLRGAKGTGKGSFANIFGEIFGQHYLPIANRDHLLGKFNAHLERTILLFVDEGYWAGLKAGESILKNLITEPRIQVEPKFVDAKSVPNHLHIVMASNESWVVPASGLERRFCVLDLDSSKAGDKKYFRAMYRQMEKGGYEAMLDDLMMMDLSSFDVSVAPKTAALREQMLHSLQGLDAWWFGKLDDGRLTKGKADWPTEIKVDTLYQDYVKNCPGSKDHLHTKSQFSAELKRFMPDQKLSLYRPWMDGKAAARMYRLPSLDECRAAWDELHGIETPWS